MKKKILFKTTLLLISIFILCSCKCSAANGLPDLSGYSAPTVQDGVIITITNTLLGVLIAIGTILITIFIALTGFGMILGSVEEKAVAKEKFSGYLIAAVVLTGGATIAKIIISIAENF